MDEHSAQRLPHSVTQQLPMFVLLALLVLLFLPTFVGLHSLWTKWDQSLSHAYPLLLWFLYLLYKAGPVAASTQPNWLRIGTGLAIVACSVAWFLFHSIQIKILEQLVLLPLFYLSIAFVFGLRSLLALRFLLIMPLFAIPIWDYLNNSLVIMASSVVGELVRWVRIPALIDGSSIFIPSGHIMIADGCSGLRYLVISLAMGYTISYLNGYKEKGLLVALSLAALLGLVANWVRIFILILVGYYTEMQSPLMEDHETFGWVVFALMCFPAIYFAPVIKQAKRSNPISHGLGLNQQLRLLAILALVLSPGLLLNQLVAASPKAEFKHYAIAPEVFTPVGPGMLLMPLLPEPTQSLYYRAQPGISLQVNYYIPQSANDRLVPYIARQFDAQVWLSEATQVVQHQGRSLQLTQLRQKSAGRRLVQLQWFDVGGTQTHSLTQAKLLQLPAVLTGNQYFTVFTLQQECAASDCTKASDALVAASASIQ